MFNEYYYTDQYQEPIYCSMITLNNSVETSLYIGGKLVKRKSLQRGFHQLKKENVELKLQIKWFKLIPELKIDKERVVLEKLKRKQLRTKLLAYGINNEINPREKSKEKFDYRQLKIPLILILLGTLWAVFMNGKGKFWEVPSMIIFVIAYVQLFSPLIDRVPDWNMDSETKNKFKLLLGIGGMILTQILISKIIN